MQGKIKQKIEVLVIGGGASGMMAAGRAGEQGKEVILLEKNSSLGKKLKITGGGRCNITNAEYDSKKLLPHYGVAEKFLYTPFSIFGVKDTFSFFESRNLPLKTEDLKRVFPVSEKAFDVYLVLERYLKENKVKVNLSSSVRHVVFKDGTINMVETSTHIFFPEKVILATGGVSHPETGSTGDGFRWLKEAGHVVHAPTPGLAPLLLEEQWVKSISGTALENIKISFYCNNEKRFTKKGRVLCTHFGISGPMILNVSAQVRDLLHEGVVTALIDLFPNVTIGALEKQFVTLFDDNKNKILKNILPDILPHGFMPAAEIIFNDIDLNTKAHSVTKEDRKKMVHKLKALEITIMELMGLEKAIVSDGGVALEEVIFKTMQSKKCENLYIAGDLLHINRPSGGYSLQLCWTTGYIAGDSV